MIKFLLVVAVTGIVVSVVSLGWYTVTKTPRPQALTAIRDALMTTSIGKQTASVLGVTKEAHVQPVNIPAVAGAMVSSVVTTVQERVQDAVVGQVVTQIAKQYDGLPSNQKKQLESIICKPTSAP